MCVNSHCLALPGVDKAGGETRRQWDRAVDVAYCRTKHKGLQ